MSYQNKGVKEQESKKDLKNIKPWMGNGINRIRSLGKPMASRATRGNR